MDPAGLSGYSLARRRIDHIWLERGAQRRGRLGSPAMEFMLLAIVSVIVVFSVGAIITGRGSGH